MRGARRQHDGASAGIGLDDLDHDRLTSTLYDELGVAPGASPADLRRAYVLQARRRHPDTGGDAAAMARLNEAWAVLSDPVRRRVYDLSLGARAVGDVDPIDAREWPIDAREWDALDDRPSSEAAPAPQRGVLPFVPPALFGGSVVVGCVGLVLDEPGVVGAAFGLFLLSCVAIAAVALLTLRATVRR